jgi:hypothetical protein
MAVCLIAAAGFRDSLSVDTGDQPCCHDAGPAWTRALAGEERPLPHGQALLGQMNGLEERVFGRLPDETWIYPGRGNMTMTDAPGAAVGWAWIRLR